MQSIKLNNILRQTLLWLFFALLASIPISIEVAIRSGSLHFTYPSEPIMAGITLLLPIYALLNRKKLPAFGMLDRWIVLFFLCAGLASCFSVFPMVSFKYMITMIWFCCSGYALPKIIQIRKTEWKTALIFFCLGTLTLCIWVLKEFVYHGVSYESSYVVSKPFIGQGHTNLSVVIEPLMIVGIGIFLLTEKKSYKVIGVLLFTIAYAVIDYSWSRASFLTSSIALLLFFLSLRPSIKRSFIFPIVASIGLIAFCIYQSFHFNDWSRYTFLAMMLLLGVLYYSIGQKTVRQFILLLLIGFSLSVGTRKISDFIHEKYIRVTSHYNPRDPATRKENSFYKTMGTSDENGTTSMTERKVRWKNGLKMLANHPYTGIGPGCFPDLQLIYLEKGLVVDQSRISYFKMNIHNIYLAWLVEGGVLWLISGLLIVGVILMSMIKFTWKSVLKNRKATNSIIKRLLFIYFTVFLMHGLFQDFTNASRVIVMFWIALGILSMIVKPKKLLNSTRKKG